MTEIITKVNNSGETVLAMLSKSGVTHMKTYTNLTQANAAAKKVGGEVMQSWRARKVFYVRFTTTN